MADFGPMDPAGAASTALSGVNSVGNMFSAFRGLGVAMRFTVVVGEPGTLQGDLGQWTSCEGLKVEFKTDDIHSGGDYGRTYALPAHVVYQPITLKRGVERQKSNMVQTWLREVANEWTSGYGEPYEGTSVTITLHDVTGMAAAQWVLDGAYPMSWTGPSLNAKGGEIATETLVIAHNGFLESEPEV